MKQKDMIIIAVAVFIAAFGSYFLSKALFAKKENRSKEVKVVEQISTDFNPPGKRYFNENSLNPTQTITIGNGQSTQSITR